jgi:hypothetical protein
MTVSKIGTWVPLGSVAPYSAGTVSTAALSYTSIIATLHANASHFLVSFDGADCRVTFDGTTPQPTVGHIFYNGDREVWAKATLAAAKFIRAAGTDVAVRVTPGQLS